MIYTTRIFNSVGSKRVIFDFEPGYEPLWHFIDSDVLSFYSIIIEELENVIQGKNEIFDCSFNVCDLRITKETCLIEFFYAETEDGYASSEISTQELYDLIKEWKRLNDELKKKN